MRYVFDQKLNKHVLKEKRFRKQWIQLLKAADILQPVCDPPIQAAPILYQMEKRLARPKTRQKKRRKVRVFSVL